MTAPSFDARRPQRPVFFYAAAMVAFMFSYGPLTGFSTNWILEQGLPYSIQTGAYLLTIALQPALGWMIGRGLVSARNLALGSIAAVIACDGLIALNAYGPLALPAPQPMLSALFVASLGLGECYHLLSNAIAMEYVNAGVRMNFGAMRALGSASYALLCIGLGRVIASAPSGASAAFPVAAVSSAVFMALVWQLKPIRGAGAPQIAARPRASYAALLAAHPGMLPLLLGIALLFISHNIMFMYQVNFLEAIGVDGSMVGTLHGIEAAIEIPGMVFASRLVKRFGAGRLLIACGCAYILKSLLYVLGADIGAFYAAAALQCASFGLYTPVIVYYINGAVGDHHRPLGLSLAASASSIGFLLGTVVSSQILGRAPGGIASLKAALMAASVAALAILIPAIARRGGTGGHPAP